MSNLTGTTNTISGSTAAVDTSSILGTPDIYTYGYNAVTMPKYDISDHLKAVYLHLREEGRKELLESGHNLETINKMLDGKKDDIDLAVSILLNCTKYLGRFQQALRKSDFYAVDGILQEYYSKNLYKI